MGTIYKITDKVWGISDLPWPVFYGIQGFIFLKIIFGAILLCLVTVTYPLLYIFGVCYLIKKKKKPNWLYFALYTGLMGWYIFCVVKYLILGYPIHQYGGWPSGDKPVACSTATETKTSENLIWKDGNLVPLDERLEMSESDIQKETTHYRITVRDPEFEYRWLNTHRKEQNLEPVYLSPRQLQKLAGVYAWDSNIKFNTEAQLLNYLCTHFDEMQKYKISSTDPYGGMPKARGGKNIEDEYNDRLEDYHDDPEDELRFNPEVFDFQDE